MLKGAGKHPYFTIVGATRAAVDLKMAPSSCQVYSLESLIDRTDRYHSISKSILCDWDKWICSALGGYERQQNDCCH